MHGIVPEHFPADWKANPRAAGPIRNRQMLAAKPDMVVAFHKDLATSRGTKDMVTIARKAGIPTLVLPEEIGFFQLAWLP